MSVADNVDTQYPRISISVIDAEVPPVRMTLQSTENSDVLVLLFRTIEEAEYAVDRILTNMRLSDEVNKHIQEKLHESRTT
jgi:hypothetical protein